MKNKIGIMQGRLSPSQDNRLQFFPKSWRLEFATARALGFDLIEWILDREDDRHSNPFWTDRYFSEIHQITRDFGIGIHTLGLDYCMRHPLIGSGGITPRDTFRNILVGACLLRVKIIGLPIHEDVALKNEEDKRQLRKLLCSCKDLLDELDLNIALESEMPAEELREYILSFDTSRIGICFDTGNLMTMGYDLSRGIRTLGDLIKEVHIKDRKIGSTQSVYLGTGDTNFKDCFEAFRSVNYLGPYILQAWRGEDYLTDAKRQLEFVKSFLKED